LVSSTAYQGSLEFALDRLDTGFDLISRGHAGEIIFVQMKRYEVRHATGTGKTESLFRVIKKLRAASEDLQRLTFLGDPNQLSPFEQAPSLTYGSARSREASDLYRALLDGTPQSQPGNAAPLTIEVINRAIGRRRVDWVAPAVRALNLIKHYTELVEELISRVAALSSKCVAPVQAVRIDDLDSSQESHRSRAPGRSCRPRLVCRELTAV
jgi:hypothetical protein